MSARDIAGEPVLENGTANFGSPAAALRSPLASALFKLDGVTGVFLGAEFVTVTKGEDDEWETLKPDVFAAIMDFYATDLPVLRDINVAADDSGTPSYV